MAATDPTKALHAAHDTVVEAIAEIGDPTARYHATTDLAAWHRDQAEKLLASPAAPVATPSAAAATKATKAPKA